LIITKKVVFLFQQILNRNIERLSEFPDCSKQGITFSCLNTAYVGTIKPAKTFSEVVLPLPDLPAKATNSPAKTRALIF